MGDRDSIKFMGTAGARFVVSKQLRYSAGTWCSFKGVNICIDPGPGTLVRCLKSNPPLDPETLEAIILSHRHLDHSTDINVLIEAMTCGRLRRRGAVFAPADAINTPEPVIFSYLHSAVERTEILSSGRYYSIRDLSFTTPVRHQHGVETYGFKFFLDYGTVSFITDTLFSPELAEYYHCDLLIMNVVLCDPIHSEGIYHLNLKDACKLIQAIKPRGGVVITHFGLTMLKSKPWKLAEEISQSTGIRVISAFDGMQIYPKELISP
ncbi:MAG: MBL fold metallo-hydrolase [Dethiobacteria bacterium]|jgi:phosphoribosyl 1,2-cyclic phosphodiesterase